MRSHIVEPVPVEAYEYKALVQLRDDVLAANALAYNDYVGDAIYDAVIDYHKAMGSVGQVRSLNVDSIDGDKITISRTLR